MRPFRTSVGRFRQRREMALASDKGKRRPRSRVVPRDDTSTAYLSEVREYLRMSRASREIDAKQLSAQLVERRAARRRQTTTAAAPRYSASR